MFSRHALVAALVLCGFAVNADRADAIVLAPAVIYSQGFNTNTANLAATEAAYPDLSGQGTVNVASGELVVTNNPSFLQTDASFNEEIWVSAKTGMFSGAPGTVAHGMTVGNRAILYFAGNGAFRILNFNTGTNTLGTQLSTPGDIVMPYTPAVNQMHTMTIHATLSGGLDVTITDTLVPTNTYSQSFNFPGYTPGKIGFNAFYGTITARFDDLSVVALREVVVPEPSTVMLLGLGLSGLAWPTRRRRNKAAEVRGAI